MKNRPIPSLSETQKAQVRGWVIFENEFLIAFNKPSGLAVQTRGNRGTSLDFLLWTFARSNGKRPHLVHRIDAGTSGVIIAAKTKPAMSFLSTEFAERRVTKSYVALVSGALPAEDQGTCDQPLLKTGRAVKPARLEGGADTASTRWKVLARRDGFALIQAQPHTGRMHQIRAHFAYLGCPILGDPIYGEQVNAAPRLMLHAAALEITLPNQERLELKAGLATDFQAQQAALGL